MDKRTKKNIINKAMDGKGGVKDAIKGSLGVGKPGLFGKQDYASGELKIPRPSTVRKITNSLFVIPSAMSKEIDSKVSDKELKSFNTGLSHGEEPSKKSDLYKLGLKKSGMSNKDMKQNMQNMKKDVIKKVLSEQYEIGPYVNIH